MYWKKIYKIDNVYSKIWATWRQKVKVGKHVNKHLCAEAYSGSFQLRAHLEACLFPNFNNTLILLSTRKSPMFGLSSTFLVRILHARTTLLTSFRNATYILVHCLSHPSSLNHLNDYWCEAFKWAWRWWWSYFWIIARCGSDYFVNISKQPAAFIFWTEE
jgi:hypothetical protein